MSAEALENELNTVFASVNEPGTPRAKKLFSFVSLVRGAVRCSKLVPEGSCSMYVLPLNQRIVGSGFRKFVQAKHRNWNIQKQNVCALKRATHEFIIESKLLRLIEVPEFGEELTRYKYPRLVPLRLAPYSDEGLELQSRLVYLAQNIRFAKIQNIAGDQTTRRLYVSGPSGEESSGHKQIVAIDQRQQASRRPFDALIDGVRLPSIRLALPACQPRLILFKNGKALISAPTVHDEVFKVGVRLQ